jgi:opacity protein-like surface antigen
MKKMTVLIFIAAISLFVSQNASAQTINLGIGGGLSIIQSPTDYKDAMGFSTEYHVGIKGKLNFPLFPITPIGIIEYHFLRGTASTPAGSLDTKQNILTLGLGGELSLVPGPISPYVGLDLEYNNLGDLEVGGTKISSGVSRTGLGIGAGVMVNILPVVNVDVSLKYQMLNLFGKEGGEDTIGIVNLNAALFF